MILQQKVSMLISRLFIYNAMQCVKCNSNKHKRYWISEFSKKIIALPSLEEQYRIVQKIEELHKYIEQSLK